MEKSNKRARQTCDFFLLPFIRKCVYISHFRFHFFMLINELDLEAIKLVCASGSFKKVLIKFNFTSKHIFWRFWQERPHFVELESANLFAVLLLKISSFHVCIHIYLVLQNIKIARKKIYKEGYHYYLTIVRTYKNTCNLQNKSSKVMHEIKRDIHNTIEYMNIERLASQPAVMTHFVWWA